MAMGTERSKALHNFTMPCGLRWGNQRFLRCMKVNSDGQISPLHRFNTNSSASSDHHHHHPIQQRRTTRDRDRDRERDYDEFAPGSTKVGPTPPPPASHGGRRFSDDDDDDGIAATRQKLTLDLQTAADKIKDVIFKNGLEEREVSISIPPSSILPPPPPPPPPPAAASLDGDTYCPWNLRTRRAACRTPVSGFAGSDGAGGKGQRVDAAQIRPAAASQKPPIQRSDGNGEKRERTKFSVALPKRDIEEDFYAMVGHRPPRRPKKRARIVQKHLDALFPGLWLTEVTAEMYKVVEVAP